MSLHKISMHHFLDRDILILITNGLNLELVIIFYKTLRFLVDIADIIFLNVYKSMDTKCVIYIHIYICIYLSFYLKKTLNKCLLTIFKITIFRWRVSFEEN